MKFLIDGKEIELENLECDTIVIARPTKRLEAKEFREFVMGIRTIRETFEHYGIALISANYDDVTFETIKAQAVKSTKKPWDY